VDVPREATAKARSKVCLEVLQPNVTVPIPIHTAKCAIHFAHVRKEARAMALVK
jgi:hypothetical protein